MVPADLVNMALDAIGSEVSIGDIEEGSREAQVCLRSYTECLRQLLRTANWDFARKQVQPFLLADATGNTPNVGTTVQYPWTYCYAYPDDCVRARFVFGNSYSSLTAPAGNTSIPNTSLMTGLSATNNINTNKIIPAKFVVATDFNYTYVSSNQLVYEAFLPFANSFDPTFYSNFMAFMQSQNALPGFNSPNGANETPGVAPTCRTVINTNIANAQLVYTAFIPYPSIWDAMFRDAFVHYLASTVALAVIKDKKFALQMRAQEIQITKQKILEARIADGNEGNYSTDHTPDWMRIRSVGGRYGDGGMDPIGWNSGGGFGGWDACMFSDGSSY